MGEGIGNFRICLGKEIEACGELGVGCDGAERVIVDNVDAIAICKGMEEEKRAR